jgi:hypothetical protein
MPGATWVYNNSLSVFHMIIGEGGLEGNLSPLYIRLFKVGISLYNKKILKWDKTFCVTGCRTAFPGKREPPGSPVCKI